MGAPNWSIGAPWIVINTNRDKKRFKTSEHMLPELASSAVNHQFL